MKRSPWIPVLVLACLWSAIAVSPAAADDPPTASFYVVCVGRVCAVDAEVSSDDFGITNYHWAWGDGQTTNGSDSDPSHTYAANGTYTITLTVTDTASQTGFTTRNVTVDLAPQAFFKLICDQRSCFVDGIASTDDIGIASYFWDWDDEGVDLTTSSTAQHEYSYDANFTVRLTVTDTTGNTGTFSRTFNPLDTLPYANFYVVCVNRTCSVDAESSGDDGYLTNYHWNWGDGQTTNGTDSDPSHTYAANGTYTITLTLTDNSSQTASDKLRVTVSN